MYNSDKKHIICRKLIQEGTLTGQNLKGNILVIAESEKHQLGDSDPREFDINESKFKSKMQQLQRQQL